jgi:hypothetical protein
MMEQTLASKTDGGFKAVSVLLAAALLLGGAASCSSGGSDEVAVGSAEAAAEQPLNDTGSESNEASDWQSVRPRSVRKVLENNGFFQVQLANGLGISGDPRDVIYKLEDQGVPDEQIDLLLFDLLKTQLEYTSSMGPHQRMDYFREIGIDISKDELDWLDNIKDTWAFDVPAKIGDDEGAYGGCIGRGCADHGE